MTRSSFARAARRLCRPGVFAGLALAGVVLVLSGAWNAAGQPLRSPGYPYDHALDRAIAARTGELVAILAACLGAVFILVAAALFAYWLVRPTGRPHRGIR